MLGLSGFFGKLWNTSSTPTSNVNRTFISVLCSGYSRLPKESILNNSLKLLYSVFKALFSLKVLQITPSQQHSLRFSYFNKNVNYDTLWHHNPRHLLEKPIVCGILQSALTCMYHNSVSTYMYFEVTPPSLEEYFYKTFMVYMSKIIQPKQSKSY